MEGGLYNGYIAIPEKYLSVAPKMAYEDDGYNESHIPFQPHGGITLLRHNIELEEILEWSDKMLTDTEGLYKGEKYVVLGFDTLHLGDTQDMWTEETVGEEALKWKASADQYYNDMLNEHLARFRAVQAIFKTYNYVTVVCYETGEVTCHKLTDEQKEKLMNCHDLEVFVYKYLWGETRNDYFLCFGSVDETHVKL